MSGGDRECGTFFETLKALRQHRGGEGHHWRCTALPRGLCEPVACVDRALIGAQGVAKILHAAVTAEQSEGGSQQVFGPSGELLGGYLIGQLLVALGELLDHGYNAIEQIAEHYPEQREPESRIAGLRG